MPYQYVGTCFQLVESMHQKHELKKSGHQMAPTLSLQLQWLEEIHSQRQSQRFSQSPPGMFQAPATPPATAATRIMPGIIINNFTIIIVIVIIVVIVINY